MFLEKKLKLILVTIYKRTLTYTCKLRIINKRILPANFYV